MTPQSPLPLAQSLPLPEAPLPECSLWSLKFVPSIVVACSSPRLLVGTWVFPLRAMMNKAAENILSQDFLWPCVFFQVKYPGVAFWGLSWMQVSAWSRLHGCAFPVAARGLPSLAGTCIRIVCARDSVCAGLCAGVSVWCGISTSLMIPRGTLFLLLISQFCVSFCVRNVCSSLFHFELDRSCGSFLLQVQVGYFYIIRTDAGM